MEATAELEHDRLLTQLDGRPGVRMTHPATIREAPDLGRTVTTCVVQVAIIEDDDKRPRLVAFAESSAGEARRALVLPDGAVRGIVQGVQRLTRRPDVDARRKRSAELARKRKRDHGRGRHARMPVRACEPCRIEAVTAEITRRKGGA